MAESPPPVVWADGDTHDRIHVATGTQWCVETVGGRLQWTHQIGDVLAIYARALTGTRWVWQVARGSEVLASGRETSEAEAIEAVLKASVRGI